MGNPFGDAAEQPAILAGSILRAEDRQSDVGVVSVLEDLLVGNAVADDGLGLDAGVVRSFGDRIDGVTSRVLECALEALELVDVLVAG